MELFHSPHQYLYNLQTTSSSTAKKIWREAIREKWNYECAYCGSKENLTLDHVVPLSNGGLDATPNVVCCCKTCNHNKSHNKWDEWFSQQNFFSENKFEKINEWINNNKIKELHPYKIRKNNCT